MTCFAAAKVSPNEGLAPLLWLVLTMNLLAATMDIAVDGFAVDVLSTRELGHGNVAQVVGYKAGMLTGGGLLVWASGTIGWSGLFVAMAGLVAMSLLVTLSWDENAVVVRQAIGLPAGRSGSQLEPAPRRLTGAWARFWPPCAAR